MDKIYQQDLRTTPVPYPYVGLLGWIGVLIFFLLISPFLL